MNLSNILLAGAVLLGPTTVAAQDIAPMAVNSLDRAPPSLVNAKVLDQKGNVIGQVQRVETDPRGKPVRLDIILNDHRNLGVAAADASYDAARNVVAVSHPLGPSVTASTKRPQL